MHLSDAHHLRRLIAGACMVVAPLVAAAFLVVGLGAIGRMVLRETDEAWEHTPEYEGFRPVPGMR